VYPVVLTFDRLCAVVLSAVCDVLSPDAPTISDAIPLAIIPPYPKPRKKSHSQRKIPIHSFENVTLNSE
jgi:hypothetical protein